MATTWHTIKARVKWAKFYEPDEYAGAERWMGNFYPFDGKDWEIIQKSGIQVKPKEDADGKYIVLRRNTKKVIKDNLVIFCPPEITGAVKVSYLDEDGQPVRSYNKGEKKVTRHGDPVVIANGSVVLVNFCTYDTAQGKGSRLENVKVLDLVTLEQKEEVKAEDVTDDEEVTIDSGDEGDKIPW